MLEKYKLLQPTVDLRIGKPIRINNLYFVVRIVKRYVLRKKCAHKWHAFYVVLKFD